MISYSEWRETKSFEHEQAAFEQLNKLFYELNDLRQSQQATSGNSYQKFAIFHYILRAEALIRVVGAILRRSAGDTIEYARAVKATLGQDFISADDSPDRYLEVLIGDFESLYQIGNVLLDQWGPHSFTLGWISKST